MRVTRVDYSPIGKPELTPQGGLKIPAFATRTGVFVYHDAVTGKEIREYRPPEEVFKQDSMAMLRGAPLALDHPPEPVGPYNFRQYTVGHVADDVRQEGDKLGATLYIQDAQAIKAVEAGRRELSCGYTVDVDETPGTSPDGERYDRIQRNIRYNHLALVPDGRAGHDVRLRLDSAGNSIVEENMTIEKFEVIGGVEYTVGTDAHRAARERRDAASKDWKSRFEKMQAELDKQTARADAAEEKLKSLRARVKEHLTQERIDSLVAARLRVTEKARAVLGKEFKADGKTNQEIKAEVIAKVYPGIRLDGKSKDYVNGMFRSISASPEKTRNDSLSDLRRAATPLPQHLQAPPANVQGAKSMAQIRQDAVMQEGQRSHRPLALSRRDTYKQMSSQPMLQGAQLEVMK